MTNAPSIDDLWLAGVDGCKAGWFRICRNRSTGELRHDVLESVFELLTHPPKPTIIAIDIPIGLPDKGARSCDQMARQLLGDRRSSVFPAPLRPMLKAVSHEEASSIRQSIESKGMSIQSWGIVPKIRDVDDALQSTPALRAAMYEVHPEVCFWAWNDGKPMRSAKKKPDGKVERIKLIEAWLGPGVCEEARGDMSKKMLADDDIADSFAALWTAHRIHDGSAASLPPVPHQDAAGLPMRIVY